MTRARDRDTTLRRRPLPSSPSRRLVALALTLAAVAAACGSTTIEPSSPTTPSAGGTATASSASPADSAASGEPASGGTETSPPPTETSVATAEPSPSGAAALGCSGSENNRSFFADAAANLSWDVYCAVLPDGWFVEAGNYRLAGGGTLRIAYRGPNGARLELREGAICGGSSDCQPSGEALGPAAYGNRDGSLVALEGGGYALVADADQPVSWLAISANLDEAAFRDIAAALLLVSP